MIEMRIIEKELGMKPELQYRFMLFSIGAGGYLCPPNENMKWSEWRTAEYVRGYNALTENPEGYSQMTNQTPCNHRTPPKHNVEYLDDKMVIVNGVQYQRVEEPKPQTLFDALLDDFDIQDREIICDTVRGWLIDHTVIETEDAERVTFTVLKEQLQMPK